MCDKDSSDEEDVFECGRCKDKFTDMTVFMQHKKDKSCQKLKKQKTCSVGESTEEANRQQDLTNDDVLDEILMSDSETQAISSIQDEEGGKTNITSISPSISEIFASKANDKDIVRHQLTLDILNALDQANKQVLDSEAASSPTVDCVLCPDWIPNQQAYGHHVQEKHGIVSQADVVQLREGLSIETQTQQQQQQQQQLPTAETTPAIIFGKTSRRARPDHSCKVCNMKFLSRFKYEQHVSSRKHRNTINKQKTDTDKCDNKRHKGRPAKKGSCHMCGSMVNSAKELHQHMKENHSNDVKRHTGNSSYGQAVAMEHQKNLCRECGVMVATKSLLRHERRCANRKRFECPLCQHQSREKNDYHSHIDSHKVWIEIDKTKLNVLWDIIDTSSGSQREDNEAARQTVESMNLAPPSQCPEKETELTLLPADLAVLGLMPKPQSDVTTVEECLDELASGISKEAHDEQTSSDKGQPSENEDVSDDNEHGSSSIKVNSRQLKCKVCVKWFVRNNLSKHMYDKHDMVKQFQCRDLTCLETFTELTTFKDHVTSHSEKLMFQCGCRHCTRHKKDVEVQYTDGMRKWKMRQYYAQLSYKCTVCWMKFPNENRLVKHQESDPHRHVCDECGKVSVSKRQLRLHKESHQDARAYLCDMCGSGFKTDRDLKKHMAAHSTERPFICKECGKGFLFKNKLTRHFNTVHSTKKPYTCEVEGCTKSFARKDKLNDHHNSHKSTPPYVCKFCNKSFYRKDSVRDHEIIHHTKEFPYLCKACDKGFLRPKGLENHQVSEHAMPVGIIRVSPPAPTVNLLKVQTTQTPQTINLLNVKTAQTVNMLKLQMEQAAPAMNLLKVQSAPTTVQQPIHKLLHNHSPSPANPLSYVIYDQSIASVLQGSTGNSDVDADAQSMQALHSLNFTQASTTEAPSSDLTYQMAYQMSNITIPDAHNIQVSFSQALAVPGNETP